MADLEVGGFYELSAGQLKDLHGPFTRTLSLWPGLWSATVASSYTHMRLKPNVFFTHKAERTFKDEQEQE